MNKLIRIAGAAVLLCAAAGAFADATVTFADLDKMSDVPRNAQDRDSMQFVFREHLNHLSRQLPPGQALKVDFLDIDLAGEEFPRVAVQDIRVLKGQADWPRLHLRFSVEQDGRVLRSGESRLSDPGYMMGPNHYGQEAYSYEKQMLDTWFRKEVLQQR